MFLNLIAQPITKGTITYEQIIDYQLEGVYDDPLWDSYIADLPKSGKSVHLLHFTVDQALYKEDLSQKQALSEHLQTAIDKANYAKTQNSKDLLRFQKKRKNRTA